LGKRLTEGGRVRGGDRRWWGRKSLRRRGAKRVGGREVGVDGGGYVLRVRGQRRRGAWRKRE